MALQWPFEGLPLGFELLFTLALIVIAGMFAWTAGLFVRALLWKDDRVPDAPPGIDDDYLWVFMVPAMDEEVTIADSVERLLAVPVRQKRVIVIDDGSEDRTPEILRGMDHPDLFVIRRDKPNAQLGKAAGLNHAYHSLDMIRGEVLREKVIVCVVDADGRIDPQAPRFAAAHFADHLVGGVQNLVRIYNRQRFLTWMQDIEFSVYGYLFQAGRNDWGTAGMGGNGQFNRLSALDEIAEGEGPWRDKLTEDQDLGLRLIGAGWDGRQELRGSISQQGLSNLRKLLRQRTRWSQGNLQAISLIGEVSRAPFAVLPRIELLAYLLMPVWQSIVGISLAAAIYLAVTGIAPFWGGGPTLQLALFYVLTFGGTVLGCIASRTGDGIRGWVLGFLIGHLYSLYTWMIWPVLIRSTARLALSRGTWAKTEREPLEGGEEQRAHSQRDADQGTGGLDEREAAIRDSRVRDVIHQRVH